MSKLKVTTIANQNDTKSVPSETVIAGSAKAWVRFNGIGVVSILDSFNVSSITDNGVGDYTLNFTNPMSNSNYGISGMASDLFVIGDNSIFTTNAKINCRDLSGVLSDSSRISLMVFSN